MRRFFLENTAAPGETVLLPPGEARHIAKVLRLQAGDTVELLDGSGLVSVAELLVVGRQVKAKIRETHDERGQDRVRLQVVQGQLKGQKMDVVIQKCTELGVARMAPFWSSRCQGKLQELTGAKKLARYQRIVESACKQCFRSDLMVVEETRSFQEVLAAFPAGEDRLLLLFWEEEHRFSLHDLVLAEKVREVTILLGPEGGLTEEEVAAARDQGWQSVSLGRRILRAETATLAAASLVQFLAGNI